MCGSPGYVAPEVLKGKGAQYKSDIFSMGSVFYNLVAGRTLFPGRSVEGVLKLNLEGNLTAAMKHINQLPNDARSLLLSLL